MASRYQVPAKIEQVIHSGMNTQESLRLPRRLEPAHTAFSHTSRLVRKLCPVIGILGCIVKGLRDEFSMRNAIASQLVRYNLSRFAMVIFQQLLEETLSSRAVTTRLEKHINHLAILVNSPPQVLLFAIYPHKYFVDVERIAEPLMPTLQPFGILGAELVAPQTNRFTAYGNTAFSQ
jgi:hypothetical protein